MNKKMNLIYSFFFFCTIIYGHEEVLVKDLSPSITSLIVTSDIKYRYATTRFSTSYVNPHSSPVSAYFYVSLPNRAYISNFTMEINGNTTVGQVKEKEEAKCIYEASVHKGQSAGLVKHRETNVFDIFVNLEPNATAVFDLTYEELLQRTLGQYSHVIHITNKEKIDRFLIEVFIREPQDIINLSVPPIQSDLLTENKTETNSLKSADIEYLGNKEVVIKYEPNFKDQNGTTGLFKVIYDVERGSGENMVYAIDGYFVHFFAPDSYQNIGKNIAFMLDISGSMNGLKLDQLKEAMVTILNSLQPEDDSFYLGVFSDDVSWMTNELTPATKSNIKSAVSYVKELKTTGSTNIYSALLDSVSKLNNLNSKEKKNLIFFLTDGQPTSGITNLTKIRNDVKEANRDISLITLGFGENCDFEFLKALASENRGFSRKIYFATDSKLQITNLYNEISNILLKDIKITYLDSAINSNELTTTYFDNYFKGSELIVSGPISKHTGPQIKVVTHLTSRSGPKEQTLVLQLNDLTFSEDLHPNPKLTSLQSLQKITHNTWLYLTLKNLLAGELTPEIKKRVIFLGVKYGFVTPLTSMVLTQTNASECGSGSLNEGFMPNSKIYYKTADIHSSKSGFQTLQTRTSLVIYFITFLLIII